MTTVLRLNMTLPGIDPTQLSMMYAAALDMAEFAEANGFAAVTTDEHHGANDGWMPATLVFTGMLAARTRTISVSVQALLLPLHDPLRVAEDLAVLDLASNGRRFFVHLARCERAKCYENMHWRRIRAACTSPTTPSGDRQKESTRIER